MKSIMSWALLSLPGYAVAHADIQPGAAARETNWAISVTVDPITDRKNASARLAATTGKGRLTIACNGLLEPTLSVQYLADGYLGNSAGIVLLRINKGSVMPAAGWDFQGRIAYTSDEGWIEQFAMALGAGDDEIVARAIDGEQQPHDAVFHSKNGAEAFRAMSAVCASPASER